MEFILYKSSQVERRESRTGNVSFKLKKFGGAAPAAEDNMTVNAQLTIALMLTMIAGHGAQAQVTNPSPDTTDNWTFVDGNKLLKSCDSSLDVDQMYCLGYIMGQFDSIGHQHGRHRYCSARPHHILDTHQRVHAGIGDSVTD